MANATNDIRTKFRHEELAITRKLTVATGVTCYQGTLVGISSGTAIVAATSSIVAGVAIEQATAGNVVTVRYNHVVRLAMSGAADTDIGLTAYAADNQTAQTSSNTAILGPIVDVESGYVWVQLTTRA